MEDYLFLVIFGVVAFGILVAGSAIRKSQKKEEEERLRFAKNARKRYAAAKAVIKIRWREQFVIDKGEIDNDHKKLVGLINEFNEGIVSYLNAEKMVPILTSFTEYTEIHFQREEELQKEAGFPLCEEHKKEHQALVETFNGLKLKALQATEDNVTDIAVEIGTFLKEWVSKHMVESDLALKPYLERKTEDAQETSELVEQHQSPPH